MTIQISFVTPHGDEVVVDTAEGENLMRVARDADVDGIVGECGGELSCATCHMYLPEPTMQSLGAPGDDETDMLEMLDNCRANSRLGCQVTVSTDMNGVSITVPDPDEA